MSGSHNSPGLISAASGVVSDEFKQHAHAPPAVKASNRGYLGAFLLSGSGYLFVADDDFVSYPQDLKIALAVAAVLGLLLLWTALRSHNQREPLVAFFALAEGGGLFLAVHSWAPELLTSFYVQAFFVALGCANLARLYLAVRGPGGNARKLVVNDINHRGNGNGRCIARCGECHIHNLSAEAIRQGRTDTIMGWRSARHAN